MYKLTMQRKLTKKTGDEKIKAQAAFILERGLGGNRGKTWKTNIVHYAPVNSGNQWIFTFDIKFEKIRGQLGSEAEYKQWEDIKAMMQMAGAVQKFQPYPWTIIERNNEQPVQDNVQEQPDTMESLIGEVNSVIRNANIIGIEEIKPIEVAKKWNELIVPEELLGPNSDEHLAQHPAWKELYGVNAQIRVLLSNIKRAQETNGESRNHAVMFGSPGSGKSTTLFAIEKMFGAGSVLKLDATSTTKAGLEKMFFSELKEIPPWFSWKKQKKQTQKL